MGVGVGEGPPTLEVVLLGSFLMLLLCSFGRPLVRASGCLRDTADHTLADGDEADEASLVLAAWLC
jgi:hypothetical protein